MMKKAIIMSVEDYQKVFQEQPWNQTIHQLSHELTAFFFGDGHPLREHLRQKVYDEEIENRRIKFDIGGYYATVNNPQTAESEWVFHVTFLSLWVMMKDREKEEIQNYDIQTMYILGKLFEHLAWQGYVTPLKDADEIERFLNYLAQHIPSVWDYFSITQLANINLPY